MITERDIETINLKYKFEKLLNAKLVGGEVDYCFTNDLNLPNDMNDGVEPDME